MVSGMDAVPGEPADNEQYREVIGFNNQRLHATLPLIELVATRERLECLKPPKNPVFPLNKREYGVLSELPIRIELMTFSLRVGGYKPGW